jgi:hypothetical protein
MASRVTVKLTKAFGNKTKVLRIGSDDEAFIRQHVKDHQPHVESIVSIEPYGESKAIGSKLADAKPIADAEEAQRSAKKVLNG